MATSPLEVIALNRKQGLHTLALLDLDPTGEGTGGQQPMQPLDASQAIIRMAEKLADGLEHLPRDTSFDDLKFESSSEICDEISSLMVVLCSDMGTDDQSISYLSVGELAEAKTGRLHCLVIPAEPSDVEANALSRWSKK